MIQTGAPAVGTCDAGPDHMNRLVSGGVHQALQSEVGGGSHWSCLGVEQVSRHRHGSDNTESPTAKKKHCPSRGGGRLDMGVKEMSHHLNDPGCCVLPVMRHVVAQKQAVVCMPSLLYKMFCTKNFLAGPSKQGLASWLAATLWGGGGCCETSKRRTVPAHCRHTPEGRV